MYDYIFFFFYSIFNRLKTVDPKDNAATMLLLVVFGHLFLILTAINFFTHTNLLTAVYGENHNKYLWLPVIILIMVFVYKLYKKRFETIAEKYKDRINIVSVKNSIIVSSLMVGPYLLAIYFLNHH